MPKDLALPFLTREMVRFEQATVFGLRIVSVSSIVATVIIRGATRNGIFTLRHTLTSAGSENTENFNIPDLPIWLNATVSSSGSQVGQIYIRCSLTANGDSLQSLFSGYLYDTNTLSWPIANAVPPCPVGMGRLVTKQDTTLAAGTDPSISGNPSRLSKVLWAVGTLTTSATVANRFVHMQISPTTPSILDFASSTAQAASTTRKYTFAPIGGLGSYIEDNDIMVSIPPDLRFYDEESVNFSTTNLQAGDQWSSVYFGLEEWVYAGAF